MTPYISIADANTYSGTKWPVQDAWDDADEDTRTRLLLESTRMIDTLNFLGEKTDVDQENQFPRGDDTGVPEDIQNATAELAFALLDGIEPELEFENLSMVAQKYANITSSYDTGNQPEHIVAGIPSVTAWRLLKPYLYDTLTMRLDRVS